MAKLSEIKGDAVFEVMADITEAVSSIALDEKAQKLFKDKKCPKGMNKQQFFFKKVKENVPYLIRNYKPQMLQILSSLNQMSVAEYAHDLTFAKLMTDVFDIINDKETQVFLSSLGETQTA